MIKNNINKEVVKNKYGFFELAEKPVSEEFLRQYYEEKYYQNNAGAYQTSYSEEEKTWINNRIRQKHIIIEKILQPKSGNIKLLDVGCGEGWVLQYFYAKGWEVTGLDFSSFAITQQNPAMSEKIIKGDIYENLSKLKTRYDVIWLENVLEHVLDPYSLLTQIYDIMSDNGVLMIEVPNDFSVLQQKLLELKFIDNPFWVCSPDHISYFNSEGLSELCLSAGLKKEFDITSFPIDFNLFNPDSNYVRDKTKGKNAHLSRVRLENLFTEISVYDTINLYESLSKLGLGREIISFFTKNDKNL